MRPSVIILGLIMFSFIVTTLIDVTVEIEQNYGLSMFNITDDGGEGGPNTINSTIDALNIESQVGLLAMNATSYAPGQPNGQLEAGANAGTSITQSGVTTLIQAVNMLLVLPKIIFETFAGFFGLADLGTTIAIMMTVGLLLFLATMTLFRPG